MDRLTAFRTLVLVAETGSFTAAAAKLSTVPSALTKRISELEKSLGAQLLHRTTHGVVLTDEGALCLERIQRVLEEVDDIEQQLASRRQEAAGQLRVSMPAAMGQIYVIPQLDRFLSAHRSIRLTLDYSDTPPDLLENRLDVAVRIGKPRDGGFIARRLARSRRVTCATPHYIASHAPLTTLKDLQDHTCIALLVDGRIRSWTFAQDGEQVAHTPRGGLTVSSGLALRESALRGLGIAQCNSILVAPELRAGQLAELLPQTSVPSEDLYVVYPPNRHAVPRAKVFIDFIRGVFKPYLQESLAG
ncbi:LysR family transcriptional regulator [Aquabacter sp. L1I39]|uniref:LysR family transcriptional regulator n=1 Tax=Aquabacter sp. L1I39 TaxID=2820278 RepID=UPI001ADA6715|nr:LysR family transcriptional regulator [Aquabacter sp. L1I39]QTL03466.1 LysR family transcriptional regulator [Aquabacter sp. L1I39]